ncbi:ATP-binding protein [bacterium]|nr:ATP-binding protein [bacterium]
MEPWYRIATPRKEVREGRSFNPDEFAIHLEQVIARTAPEDYREPEKFFARTCFTRAIREHTGMVLRRLAGETVNTAPVMTLITQFGGGKTHTLAALYHLTTYGEVAVHHPGVQALIAEAGISTVPSARVAAFVGNAWDPQEGRETPWIDLAWQLAGAEGVKELGSAALTTPPGTEALARVFKAAGKPVLLLFDEVLNFLNRHRVMSDQFHAFIQNLTVATTGTTNCAAVISLPRSQVEMTDWDMQWQDKITKVVRRVAKDLIANDEAEISEVVRRRLFEEIGNEKARKQICKKYADWCFERRAQLPPEWTAVDSATTETKAREYLRSRFEVCYPFHPATLSVFQRKWQALSQYQQTRGTLAMLAQWISWAYRTGFVEARSEPLITLGSAPLEVPEFRSIVLGQLGESRLVAAIDADISGAQAHARSLDADTKGALQHIHRRVGTTILFESSGGQIDKVAHLPELRFALGEPDVDTTSVDNAALALEAKSYFFRRVGSDGLKISHQPTMKKVVSDRRASLDEETEVKPAMRILIQKEFERGASIPIVRFPPDGSSIQDTPKLNLVLIEPEYEWTGAGPFRNQIAEWTRQRGKSPRLYPGSLVWCLKKPGREFREKVELWLAWKRVAKEIGDGSLGGDFDRSDRADLQTKVSDAEGYAKDEVWAGYRFIIISDNKEPDGLKVIDLGAGHSSSNETLCGRVITALKSQGLLNESVGASYIERNWPPALKASGAWPLASLRQSFLNGSLTRLLDPDTILRNKIVEFVLKGEFGLASGQKSNGSYERVQFSESIDPADVTFESGVFLLLKSKAQNCLVTPEPGPAVIEESTTTTVTVPPIEPEPETETEPIPDTGVRTFRMCGDIPPEIWNRLGTKILPKLRSGSELKIGIDFSVTVDRQLEKTFETELNQILSDLGLTGRVCIE